MKEDNKMQAVRENWGVDIWGLVEKTKNDCTPGGIKREEHIAAQQSRWCRTYKAKEQAK